VNRRSFLRRAGLLAGGAVVGASAAAGTNDHHLHMDVSLSGHAVGSARLPGTVSTTLAYRGDTTEPLVALTFDDGPSARYTAHVLDVLEQKDVRATFFMIGEHVAALPDLARRVAARHEIGNHTWSHPNMSLAHAADAKHQLDRGAEIIAATTGRTPMLFRPPFGYFSGATAMIATGMRYPIVLWDAKFNVHDSAASNVERIGSTVGPGSIVLGHDGGTLNNDVVVQALPQLIDRLRAQGLQLVTLPELFAATTPPEQSHERIVRA